MIQRRSQLSATTKLHIFVYPVHMVCCLHSFLLLPAFVALLEICSFVMKMYFFRNWLNVFQKVCTGQGCKRDFPVWCSGQQTESSCENHFVQIPFSRSSAKYEAANWKNWDGWKHRALNNIVDPAVCMVGLNITRNITIEFRIKHTVACFLYMFCVKGL